MSAPVYRSLLEGLTRVPGVRSALLVDGEDGLVVAEASMEGIDTGAVAALAASLLRRLTLTAESAGLPPPGLMHLEAAGGAVMAIPADPALLLVAVGDPDANLGLLRLALKDAAGRLG